MAVSKIAGVFLILLGSNMAIGSDTPYTGSRLQGTVWEQTVALKDGVPQNPKKHDDIIASLLNRAQLYFSAILYGYEFEYQPSDAARKISEKFTYKTMGIIPRGSKNLSYVESTSSQDLVTLTLSYDPSKTELARLELWASPAIPDSTGSGKSKFDTSAKTDVESLELAFQDALKESVRNLSRSITKNKPDKIKGRLSLARFPAVQIEGGFWVVRVETRIKIEKIDDYATY